MALGRHCNLCCNLGRVVPRHVEDGADPVSCFSKPHVARKLISKDGKNAWILVKLRAFPSEDEWKQTATMFPGVTVTAVGNIPQYTTMMQYLVRGQMLSFIISVLIIAVILMIAFQSVRVGRNHSGFSNCLTT